MAARKPSLAEIAKERLTALRAIEAAAQQARPQNKTPDAEVAVVRVALTEWFHQTVQLLQPYSLGLADRLEGCHVSGSGRGLLFDIQASCEHAGRLLSVHTDNAVSARTFPPEREVQGLTAEDLAALPIATVLKAVRIKHLVILAGPLVLVAGFAYGLGHAWGRVLASNEQQVRVMEAAQARGAAEQALEACEAAIAKFNAARPAPDPPAPKNTQPQAPAAGASSP